MKRRTFLAGSGALLLSGLSACSETTTPADPDAGATGGGSGTGSGTGTGDGTGGGTGSGGNGTATGYRALAIPPLIEGQANPALGTRDVMLELQSGVSRFLDGLDTTTWGINGAFLGPAVRLRKGDRARMQVVNRLPETTTLHWHGMKLPGPMDGGPHQEIAPGETWMAEFDIVQGASMNWFHPHKEGVTGRHVQMGLAGLLLIEDEVSDALNLPSAWGVDDIPLILQDRRFNADGSFDYSLAMMEAMRGFRGDHYLVNGTLDAGVALPPKEVRLRILNGSNAREYDLAFSDGRSFRQIATDGGLTENAVALTRLRLTPGERAEILVDLRNDAGEMLYLLNRADADARLLTLDVQTSGGSSETVADVLTSLTHLDPAGATTRSFVFGMMRGRFTINGKSMDMNRIDLSVPRGRVEIWEVVNRMDMLHNFHVHGTHFEILDRNGNASLVEDWERGYKDTVRLGPGETVRLLLSFEHYTTTADAPYMFHCHILEHEDRGMMGQFTVA